MKEKPSFVFDLRTCLIIFFSSMVFFPLMLASCEGGKGPARTDGVFESAIEKLDRGQTLNEKEMKRVDDILRYNEKE